MLTETIEKNERLAFTYQEAALAANISVPMVRKLVRTKQLEAVKIGRLVRIPRAALLRLCGAAQ
jgi:excisionase family DNA binding protein